MILLNTMVLSELCRARPNAGVVAYLKAQAPESVFLSAMTIGEIEAGIEKQRKVAPEQKNRTAERRGRRGFAEKRPKNAF